MLLLTLQLVSAYLLVTAAWPPSRELRGAAVLQRAAVHLAVAAACINLGLDGRIGVSIAVLAAAHALLDRLGDASESHAADRSPRPVRTFLLAQFLHAVAIVSTVLFVYPDDRSHAQDLLVNVLRRRDLYAILAGYVAVVFVGGQLVQRISESFLIKIDQDVKSLKPGLPEAGK